MKIGIRGHDAKVGQIEEVVKTIKDYGFDYVQLVVNKALLDKNGNKMILSGENAPLIAKAFKDANLNVAMLGAYFNPVHSNKEKLRNTIEYFKTNLKLASLFDCKYVGTETGSYNDDKWTYNPKNHTDEAFNEVKGVFLELLETAKKYKSTILIEPAYNHVICNPKRLKALLDELNDEEHVKVTIDIYNLLNNENYDNYKEIFKECLLLFKNKIKIIHLKDFVINEGKVVQTDVGKGIVDYCYLIKLLKNICDDVVCIFEGVKSESINYSLAFIKNLI